MALTTVGSNIGYSPAGNDAYWIIASTLASTKTNFRYVFELWSEDESVLLARVKKYPDTENNQGIILVNSVLKDHVSFDINLNAGPQENEISYTGFVLKAFEEYSNSPGDIPAIDLASELYFAVGANYVFNGVLGHLEFLTWNADDWLVRSASPGKFLTNAPRGQQKAGPGENAWLYYMTDEAESGTEAAANIVVRTYTGTSETATFTIANDKKGERFVRIPSGPGNLAGLVSSSGAISEADFKDITRYTIALNNGSGTTSEVFAYDLTCLDSKFGSRRIHFLNRLGGFDSYTFTMKARESVDIVREVQERELKGYLSGGGWGYTASSRGTEQYRTTEQRKLRIYTDWLTDEETDWLLELVSSPVVYLQEGSDLIPLQVENKSHHIYRRQVDGLKNLELECRYGFVSYR